MGKRKSGIGIFLTLMGLLCSFSEAANTTSPAASSQAVSAPEMVAVGRVTEEELPPLGMAELAPARSPASMEAPFTEVPSSDIPIHDIAPSELSLPKQTGKEAPSQPVKRASAPSRSGVSYDSFQELLKVYRAKELTRAITEVKRLKGQGGAEIAAYIMGEIYLQQAEDGDASALPQSMTLFKRAVAAYPESEHIPFGNLRIGQIYARQKLFYEAIGHFGRVVDYQGPTRFRLKARIGMAQAYQAWEKWDRAKAIYEMILEMYQLPDEERAEVQLGYADILYQTGQFDAAYQLYRKAAAIIPAYRFRDPIALFQFAESAYRARHFQNAKGLFLKFYNIYPEQPFAPFALIRFETLLKIEDPDGKSSTLVTPNLASIDETIDRVAFTLRGRANRESGDLNQILLSMKALKECIRRDPSEGAPKKGVTAMPDGTPCSLPLEEEAFFPSSEWSHPFRESIRAHAMQLLSPNPSPSITAQGVLLEAIYQLKKYKDTESVMEIETALLSRLPPDSPYRREVYDNFHETIVKQLDELEDPLLIVTLFHHYSSVFTKSMLAGEIGFALAESHADLGLISQAANFYLPVSQNFKHPASDEALYRLGKLYLQLGEDQKAQRALEQYRGRFPKGQMVFSELGDLSLKQGEVDKAVLFYEYWLSRYPNHPQHREIYLKLAEAHRYRNDFDNEIRVYLKWIREARGEGPLPYPYLAEAYFQSGQYQKAAESYQWIISHPKGETLGKTQSRSEREMEWAQLRLGMSYQLIGQVEDGNRIFKRVARRAKDPLIKQMAQTRLGLS
jgi:tetratricopeptide (TPR) repeat protein